MEASGILRISLIAMNVREIIAELETDQLIDRTTHQLACEEVEAAYCYEDEILLYKTTACVVMQCLASSPRRELPAGINQERVSCIELSSVKFSRFLAPATYRHQDGITYAVANRYMVKESHTPDPGLIRFWQWSIFTKGEDVNPVFELFHQIEEGQVYPIATEGKDYIEGAIIIGECTDGVSTHVIPKTEIHQPL